MKKLKSFFLLIISLKNELTEFVLEIVKYLKFYLVIIGVLAITNMSRVNAKEEAVVFRLVKIVSFKI